MASNETDKNADEKQWHPPDHCDVPEIERGETYECSCGRTWLARYSNYHDKVFYEITTQAGASDNYTAEVLSHVPSERSSLTLDTDVLRAEITDDDVDFDLGVEVHQDGRNIALKAGSLQDELGHSESRLLAYMGLDADDAREIADALWIAAENAERDYEHAEDREPDTDDSILRRLLS